MLEAITTKKCQEKFDLESLEALGDSFLKYAACQQVFKMHQDKHEGILSLKKSKIISNANLCKLGCSRKLPVYFLNPKKLSTEHNTVSILYSILHFCFCNCLTTAFLYIFI